MLTGLGFPQNKDIFYVLRLSSFIMGLMGWEFAYIMYILENNCGPVHERVVTVIPNE